MRKIGIMGGTFDPIHNGHLMLGKYAKAQFSLDEVWFMPNGMPPHKSECTIESQTKHRVEMVKKAIAQESSFALQLYEVLRKEVNYSYLTMEHFKKCYPEDEFFFIIGADSLFSLEKWKCPERFFQTCVILAAYRDGKNEQEMNAQIIYLNQKYNSDIRLLKTPNLDISSTILRDRLRKGLNVETMIPAIVQEYIFEHQLYRDSEDLENMKQMIRQQQNENRYRHTIGVAETAVSLAKRYHADKQKAELAALLHDCAKELYPGLLHAKKGAEIARQQYGIEDEEILNAIYWHTTGHPDMTKLEKIIYIADYIEPHRNQAPNLAELRQLSQINLDECLFKILEDTLIYLKQSAKVIDPMTEQTYQYYKNILNK